MKTTLTYGFIGLGLIGGTLARAIRQKYPTSTILAHDIDIESLRSAQQEGIIDQISFDIDTSFSKCAVIFLCAPVASNNDNLLRLKPYLSSNTLLTDVGSVKSDIHAHIASLGLNNQFIGGHPMAGSERIGYLNSKAEILENAYYILTPTLEVPKEKIDFYQQLVSSFGAIPLVLSAKEHDFFTAGISHLPHVISASLVNLVQASDNADGVMKMIAAGGFKDITRISSSSSTMWEHICMTNSENIIQLLQLYIHSLQQIQTVIQEHDSEKIFSFFESARIYRESFIEASSGPIKKVFVLYVEIPDEPGALATIVTLLAFQRINIKNIGITHNREVEEGSLRIELHEEKDVQRAKKILTDKNYQVRIPT